jgi:hypothetical protein
MRERPEASAADRVDLLQRREKVKQYRNLAAFSLVEL